MQAASGYDTPTFSWSSVPSVVNYNLYVQDAVTGQVVIDNTTLTGTSFAPGPLLLAGHSYTWWIGSEAAAGGLGGIAWSGAVNFTSAAAGRAEQPDNDLLRFYSHVELEWRPGGGFLSPDCGGCIHGGDAHGQQQPDGSIVRDHGGG